MAKDSVKEPPRPAEKGRSLLQKKAKVVMDTLKDVIEINRQEFM